MTDGFKPYPHDPRYLVSRTGAVIGPRGHVLRQPVSSSGYRLVMIGKANPQYVHVLVLQTFKGPRPNGYVSRHLDGVKINNNLSNLEWGTPSENNIDQVHHGVAGKLNATDVLRIKHRLKRPYKGLGRELAKEFGVHETTITHIKNGRQHVHI